MTDQVLPKPLLDRVAQRFKVLSEPIRLEILNQLMANGEMSVNELVEASGHQQATVSKHLNLMAREGLLARRKEGLRVFYRIEDPTVHGICMLVCGRLKEEIEGAQEMVRTVP